MSIGKKIGKSVYILDEHISYLVTWSKTNRFKKIRFEQFTDFDNHYVTIKPPIESNKNIHNSIVKQTG
jgi:hypothetical protein